MTNKPHVLSYIEGKSSSGNSHLKTQSRNNNKFVGGTTTGTFM
jgi:hypothetical protein